MPLMRITPLGRQRLYLTRHMWADADHAFIEPGVMEAAKALGYAEEQTAESPVADEATEATQPQRPRRRGRPTKAAKAAQRAQAAADYQDKTVSELREEAAARGVDLPSGYIKKDDLVDIVKDAETDQGEESND